MTRSGLLHYNGVAVQILSQEVWDIFSIGLLGFPTVAVVGVAILAGVAGIVVLRRRVRVPSESTTDLPIAAVSASVSDAPPHRVHVQLLKTPGCASCNGIERSWQALGPRYGDLVQLEVVDLLDQPEVARRYGVLRSPAVVIDGELRAQGGLGTAQLQRLLDEAFEHHRAITSSGEALRD